MTLLSRWAFSGSAPGVTCLSRIRAKCATSCLQVLTNSLGELFSIKTTNEGGADDQHLGRKLRTTTDRLEYRDRGGARRSCGDVAHADWSRRRREAQDRRER